MGAPWISFEPCGFIEHNDVTLTGYQKAPNIERWIVHVEAIAAILVPAIRHEGKRCIALIMKNGRRIVVVGSEQTVLGKLTADRPDCTQPEPIHRRDRDTQRTDQGR